MSAANDSGEDRFDRGGNRGDDTSPAITPAEDTGDPAVPASRYLATNLMLLVLIVVAHVLAFVLSP